MIDELLLQIIVSDAIVTQVGQLPGKGWPDKINHYESTERLGTLLSSLCFKDRSSDSH
jgi:hypothetical protein